MAAAPSQSSPASAHAPQASTNAPPAPAKSPRAAGERALDAAGDALLIIDVLNDLEFDTGPALLRSAWPAAQRIHRLKAGVKARGAPVIYVNDNWGQWRSDMRQVVAHCLRDGVRGQALAALLAPEEDDYIVIKSRHSGFFGTSLELLLQHLGARSLILTGLTTDICVLFTAHDAYLRRYDLRVPADCVACAEAEPHRWALRHMAEVCLADIAAAKESPA